MATAPTFTLTPAQQAIANAFPPISPVRYIGWIWLGQSNQQGAALNANGRGGVFLRSRYLGITDPFPLNANGAGSCLPRLLDLGLDRRVHYMLFNGAIGGAEIAYFPGRVGATITNPTGPAATLNTNGSSMSVGTGAICRPGTAGFDPFTLLARCRAEMLKWPQITEWIVSFANAESDGGTAQDAYRDSHVSIADYFLGLKTSDNINVIAYFAGLSSRGQNDSAGMNRLSAGVDAAIAILKAQGKPAFKGGDLWKLYGTRFPSYPESSAPEILVHNVIKGQEDQARVWDDAVGQVIA